MVEGLPYYDPKITQESLDDLTTFLSMVNKTMGFFPTVIGGWAVYYHTRDQKSQDIDIVMPDEMSFYKFIENDFFRKRGYDDQEKGTDYQHYGRPTIDSNGKLTTIHLDVMYGDKKQPIKGLGIIKDWSLVLKNQIEVDFEGHKMYVPVIELLITLKIIAALEREYDKRYENDFERLAQLNSKIKKDYLDVASLIKVHEVKRTSGTKLDKTKLKEFYKLTNTQSHVNKFVNQYDVSYRDILDIGVTMNSIRTALLV